MQPTELQTIGQEVLSVCAQVPTAVNTEADYTDAASWIIRLRKRIKEWDGFFDKLDKPLREARATLKKQKDELLAPAFETDRKLNSLTTAFIVRQQEKVDRQNEQKMERYEAKVEQADDPSAVPLPKLKEAPPAKVQTDLGGLSVRKVTKWRIKAHPELNSDTLKTLDDLTAADPRLKDLPPQCFVLDPARVMIQAKAGCAAVELYYDKTTVVR